MKKRVLAIAMATLMCAGVFAGCGGGSTSSKPSSGSAAASGSAATGSTSATGDAEYEMIAGTSTPETHPYNLGMNKIGELVSEKTDGAVKLDVFGNSQLGSERDLLEGLQLGSLLQDSQIHSSYLTFHSFSKQQSRQEPFLTAKLDRKFFTL